MIISCLNNSNKELAAEFLLREYESNRQMFELCKYELKGRIKQVPMLFCNDGYYTGNKFINKSNVSFFGEVVRWLVVAQKFKKLANYLECPPISSIHYDDIDFEVSELTADDVEDFWHGGFDFKVEIIKGFTKNAKIPREILEQYNLDGIDNCEIDTTCYSFPTKPVIDLHSLRRHIASTKLNKITIKEVTEQKRVPDFPHDKRSYVMRTYTCGNGIYACQMCRKFVREKYMEINAIEYEPEFAWEQMQLCLCLNCSKDFESLRRNKEFRDRFMRSIVEASIEEEESIAVAIGTSYLLFTATHLAEIQEIIKRQRAL